MLKEFFSGKSSASSETPLFHGQVGYSDGVFAVREKILHTQMKKFGGGPRDMLGWLVNITVELDGPRTRPGRTRSMSPLEEARWIEPSTEGLVEAVGHADKALYEFTSRHIPADVRHRDIVGHGSRSTGRPCTTLASSRPT